MAGADLFETDFPFKIAQKDLLLQVKTKGYQQGTDYIGLLKDKYKSVDTGEDILLYIAIISEKLEEKQLTVDLNFFQRGYRWSESPLFEGCECYTCKNYSRSYLYHLYEVKEMNAYILTTL